MGSKIKAKGRADKGKFATPPDVPDNSNNEPPVFSLRYLCKSACLTNCVGEEKIAFADTLYKMSQRTWIEIINTNRHKGGTEKIAQDSINHALPPHITPDVTLLAIRFCHMKPMIGYRDKAIFYILWLDRNFDVYDHG